MLSQESSRDKQGSRLMPTPPSLIKHPAAELVAFWGTGAGRAGRELGVQAGRGGGTWAAGEGSHSRKSKDMRKESKADPGTVPLDSWQLSTMHFFQTSHPCWLTCVCRSPTASSRARAGSPILAVIAAGPGWGTKKDVDTTIT